MKPGMDSNHGWTPTHTDRGRTNIEPGDPEMRTEVNEGNQERNRTASDLERGISGAPSPGRGRAVLMLAAFRLSLGRMNAGVIGRWAALLLLIGGAMLLTSCATGPWQPELPEKGSAKGGAAYLMAR